MEHVEGLTIWFFIFSLAGVSEECISLRIPHDVLAPIEDAMEEQSIVFNDWKFHFDTRSKTLKFSHEDGEMELLTYKKVMEGLVSSFKRELNMELVVDKLEFAPFAAGDVNIYARQRGSNQSSYIPIPNPYRKLEDILMSAINMAIVSEEQRITPRIPHREPPWGSRYEQTINFDGKGEQFNRRDDKSHHHMAPPSSAAPI